jgi:cell division transport system ATP-binding protein
MSEGDLVDLRRHTVAYVFQAFGLLPILSAAENVEVPLRLVRTDPEERDRRVAEVLDLVGVGHRAGHRPHELSGGEQQRVAIARSLVNDPVIILADEPTGNLDPDLSLEIMNLFREINARGTTVVVATHDRDIVRRVRKRSVVLNGGRMSLPLVSDEEYSRTNVCAS